jgi:hypothetical protein
VNRQVTAFRPSTLLPPLIVCLPAMVMPAERLGFAFSRPTTGTRFHEYHRFLLESQQLCGSASGHTLRRTLLIAQVRRGTVRQSGASVISVQSGPRGRSLRNEPAQSGRHSTPR